MKLKEGEEKMGKPLDKKEIWRNGEFMIGLSSCRKNMYSYEQLIDSSRWRRREGSLLIYCYYESWIGYIQRSIKNIKK